MSTGKSPDALHLTSLPDLQQEVRRLWSVWRLRVLRAEGEVRDAEQEVVFLAGQLAEAKKRLSAAKVSLGYKKRHLAAAERKARKLMG